MAGMIQCLLILLYLTVYTAYKVPNILVQHSHHYRGLLSAPQSRSVSHTSSQKLQMSFVQDEMRPYAIKYHSRDQTSQGQLPAQVPFTKWNPSRQDYLHFLVDSLAVYDFIETSVAAHPVLKQIRVRGLERAAALRQDINWLCAYDTSLTLPPTGEAGLTYSSFLQQLLLANDLPGLVCHYYNQYFALSAGGMRIGQYLSGKLLGGKKLSLYSFEAPVGQDDSENEDEEDGYADVDVVSTAPTITTTSTVITAHGAQSSADAAHVEVLNTLKDGLRQKIDALAALWSAEQRLHCCTETEHCFTYGNAMLKYLHGTAGGASASG